MSDPHATIEDAVKKAAAVVSYESVGHVTFDRAEAVILSELAPWVAERENAVGEAFNRGQMAAIQSIAVTMGMGPDTRYTFDSIGVRIDALAGRSKP